MAGLLIAIEGINGCGKTTIINNILKYYKDKKEVVVYKFPNRTTKYGKILDKFLKKEIQIESKYDILDLFTKNRQEFQDSILNDIKANKIVICDRYTISGIVYQIPLYANEESYKYYYQLLNYFDKHTHIPNLTFLIDGDFLHLRDDVSQRYHYNSNTSNQIFNIFNKILNCSNQEYIIVSNKVNDINYASDTIIYNIQKLLE